MRTTAELDLLEQIYTEMQELKRRMENNQEFAHMLNIEPETLDARIREGRYQKPHKDGRKSFWLLSYVQAVVTNISESDTVAA